MIRSRVAERSAAGFGQQLQLRRSLSDDAARRLVQPVEARIQSRIAAGGVARETEMAVEPGLHALGLSVQAEEQKIGRGFGEMEERECEESHSRFVSGVDRREEGGLADRTLLT